MSSRVEVNEWSDSVWTGGTVSIAEQHQATDFRRRLGLAPMEGVTDFATRLWIAQIAGPDEATTPFLRVTKDYPPKRISANFLPEIELSKEHGIVTCIPQLMASETNDIIRIAEHFLPRVPFVDINCGCPSPTVVGNGAGSSLLRSPELFHKYLSKIVSALGPSRVSVKMRLGFDHESEFASLLEVLQALPLARLTIHGRTRADRYKGRARWNFIDEATRQLRYPIVGSGDVVDRRSYLERVLAAPRMSGVLIGRGALRNPWIFEMIRTEDESSTSISFQLLMNRVLQFCLLQELNVHHWEIFIEQVRNGFFAQPLGRNAELVGEQNARLATRVFGGDQIRTLTPDEWPLGRMGVARGKMLWNYLRSGLDIDPLHSVALLRASDWGAFVSALSQMRVLFPADSVKLGYHQHWDWIYAGDSQLKPTQGDGHEPAHRGS